ncbi:hypothetical protein PHLGIDRAFT_319087 [Phlebiopsis gigantea 11061_1 CR5-6]|uniref:Uncharacterized protein n=1 Tax=Phlebiopsis gigantea (strain 11061_1 CR5-6) TaxID=745531 RepID=A0A0C3NBV6_PHLG1|nr:hypothetical protein PHLGIDRAFT_319087 [Phlebiopsis gigantea 11061_1 CR5-6]
MEYGGGVSQGCCCVPRLGRSVRIPLLDDRATAVLITWLQRLAAKAWHRLPPERNAANSAASSVIPTPSLIRQAARLLLYSMLTAGNDPDDGVCSAVAKGATRARTNEGCPVRGFHMWRANPPYLPRMTNAGDPHARRAAQTTALWCLAGGCPATVHDRE